MTALMDMIADEVVFEPADHKFEVDGAEFPWYISERGPIITRVSDDLFVVDVEIVQMHRGNQQYLSFEYRSGYFGNYDGDTTWSGPPPFVPVIGGEPFPWLCTEDEMVLRFSHKQIPTLALKFYARNVSSSARIRDSRDIFCAGGSLVASSAKE
jgi:hypothetical protein